MIDALSTLATGRAQSLFAADLKNLREKIASAISGKRILVIGGAGSIGSSTIKEIVRFSPACLHAVDTNENQLAELVRDLRSSTHGLDVKDFRTLPIDFGDQIMRRFIFENPSYDLVLNFAALKHVRSEKDIYSLMQMYDTNVLKPARLMAWLKERGGTESYFCVSTDKAAHPVNLMGASKRLMEHVIFSPELNHGLRVTSARFANVAFSEGSLLQSFQRRLEKSQPLASPVETKRFFISLKEAGELCLIAATCAPPQSLMIPKLKAESDLILIDEIAKEFLKSHGLEPKLYQNEEEARAHLVHDRKNMQYPLLLTPLDTQGEKAFEEFVGDNETSHEIGCEQLEVISYEEKHRSESISHVLEEISRVTHLSQLDFDKDRLIQLVQKVVPDLEHKKSDKTLDQRM